MNSIENIDQKWTVPEVRKDLAGMNLNERKYKGALVTGLAIVCIGLVSLAFNSSLITYGAVVFSVITIGVIQYYENKISKVKNKFHELGLQRSDLTKIRVNEFKNGLEEIEDWSEESSKTLTSRVSPFLDGYVKNITFFGNSKESKNAGICIAEGVLDDATKVSLLKVALSQKIPLFFSSLQNYSSTAMKGSSFRFYQENKIKQKIKESAFISARFIKACLEVSEGTTIDVCSINRQLKALSFKYFKNLNDSTTIETISPTYQVFKDSRNQIVIQMIANKLFPGAEGDLSELIKILDHDGKTVIEVVGEGWKNGLKIQATNWSEYIQRYTKTVKCVSNIRDKLLSRDDIPFWI